MSIQEALGPIIWARVADVGELEGHLKLNLGRSWGFLRPSLGHPEAILGPSWAILGNLGVLGLSYLDLPAGPGICWASLAELATEGPPNREQSVESLVSPTCARENEKFPV